MNKKNQKKEYVWAIKVTILSFFISFLMNTVSQVLIGNSNLTGALLVLFGIVLLGVVCDMVGTAITSANEAPFNSMAANKVSGADLAVTLVRNAPIVCNILNDVVGDICGIISGATVAVIIVKIAQIYSLADTVLISLIINAIVASLTIGGKAYCKNFALSKTNEIIYRAAKILNLFTFFRRKK